ncbi:MAG: glycoside hydrolase family 3 C-terminal domain-containing protein [Saccharospirillaceae bacterium]|nr:glycoside hydrolase family 3 protein [Pseudomonadales bacterium]NRB81074.1 glycoside hydrolase family 3 C-terminal domain-containing protein [Saccharospirillaceae bacterium]
MKYNINSKMIIKRGLIFFLILLFCQAFWLAFITPSPELKTLYQNPNFYSTDHPNYLKQWPNNVAPDLDVERELFIQQILEKLSIEEKIAQMILLPNGMPMSDFERYPFSGIVFDQGANSKDGKKLRNWHKKLDKLWVLQQDYAQEHSRVFIPPFFKLDVLAGNALTLNQTIFPTRLNLGQSQNPLLVEAIAKAQAKQAAFIGFNWITEGFDSPIHDKRITQMGQSFSEDPALNAILAASYVKGAQFTQPTQSNEPINEQDSLQVSKQDTQINNSEDPALNTILATSYVKETQLTQSTDSLESINEQDSLQNSSQDSIQNSHTQIMTSSRGYLALGAGSFTRANIFEDESVLLNRYAPGHIAAIKQGVLSVELSNGRINSEDMINSEYYIQQILKNTMGFNGVVSTTLNATAQISGCRLASCNSAINAGVDLFYFNSDVSIQSGPASYGKKTYDASEKFILNTKQSVLSGKIKIERINDAVTRVLRVKHQLGLFDYISPSERAQKIKVDQTQIEALAKQAVKQSAVILKNAANTLPLNKNYKVLLTGLGADQLNYQIGYWPNTNMRNTNNRSIKKGISLNKSFKQNKLDVRFDFIPFEYIDSLAITNKALQQHLKREDNIMVPKKDKKGIYGEIEQLNSEQTDKVLLYQQNYEKQIKKITQHYKQIVMVISQTNVANGEQVEQHLNFSQYYQNQLKVFELLENLDSTITVIFYGHAPMYMPKIMDKANAIIFAGHPGSDASGLLDVLFNEDMQLFAKLAFSWPRQPCDFKQSLGVLDYDPFLTMGYGLSAYDKKTPWYSAVPEEVEYCTAIKR